MWKSIQYLKWHVRYFLLSYITIVSFAFDFFFAGHRYLKHERIQRFTIYNKYGAWNFAGVNLVNWRCECQHLCVLREQILTDWNLKNFAWKQFFPISRFLQQNIGKEKNKTFQICNFWTSSYTERSYAT